MWELVTRPEEQTNKFHTLDRQDQLEEAVVEENIVRDSLGKGDLTLFNLQSLHRGPASNGIGYAFFAAWSTPGYAATGLNTDGVPVHKANWKKEFKKWLDTSRQGEDHKGNKFIALAKKIDWTKKKKKT